MTLVVEQTLNSYFYPLFIFYPKAILDTYTLIKWNDQHEKKILPQSDNSEIILYYKFTKGNLREMNNNFSEEKIFVINICASDLNYERKLGYSISADSNKIIHDIKELNLCLDQEVEKNGNYISSISIGQHKISYIRSIAVNNLKQIFLNRKIKNLIHFTHIDNVEDILNKGLLSNRMLERENIRNRKNDDLRLDNIEDGICTSVEFPNSKMFYTKRMKNNENADNKSNWVVIQLNINLLLSHLCIFSKINAASSDIKDDIQAQLADITENNECINYYSKKFEGMFTYKEESRKNLNSKYPTDVQAEILILGRIETEYIEKLFFFSKEYLEKFLQEHPAVDSTKFSYDSSLFYQREG